MPVTAPPSATASTRLHTPRATRSPISRRRTHTRRNLPSTTEERRRVKLDATSEVSLELDDIQAGALYERPSPYVGPFLLLGIRDRAEGGELVRRLHRIVSPAGSAEIP